MRQLFAQRFFHELRKNFTRDESLLGRWNLNDNTEIKAQLANMDSCGDSLCGSPPEFKESINTILNDTKSKSNTNVIN